MTTKPRQGKPYPPIPTKPLGCRSDEVVIVGNQHWTAHHYLWKKRIQHFFRNPAQVERYLKVTDRYAHGWDHQNRIVYYREFK